ncbi:hypothetical protein J6590_011226 [Homalodisca vitripennis]|nr:hypothetical protein J6590_011226 [Homalodisca vitripennis]
MNEREAEAARGTGRESVVVSHSSLQVLHLYRDPDTLGRARDAYIGQHQQMTDGLCLCLSQHKVSQMYCLCSSNYTALSAVLKISQSLLSLLGENVEPGRSRSYRSERVKVVESASSRRALQELAPMSH